MRSRSCGPIKSHCVAASVGARSVLGPHTRGKAPLLDMGKANSREMRTSLLEIAGSETSIPLTRYVSLFRNGRTRHFRDVSRC